MKVAVTGASGFLGKVLTRHLVELRRGYQVVELSRANTRYDDIRELERLLQGVDVVVHLAGIAHASGFSQADYEAAIIQTTQNLWRAAKSVGCKRFVFASTIKVYGQVYLDSGAVDESSPCRPEGAYGICKYEAERFLLDVANKGAMESIVFRFPPMIGPGARGSVRHLARAAKWRLPLPVHGLTNLRSFLFVENAARIIEAAVTGTFKAGCYVPIDSEPWTIGAFYGSLFQAANESPLPRWAKWRLPGLAVQILKRFRSLAPLFEHFPLTSNHLAIFKSLQLQSPESAVRSIFYPTA